MDLELPVGILSTQLMVQLGMEHGAPEQWLLNGTGIGREQLLDPHSEVARRQELALTRNLIRECPDVPDLGIQAGQRYHLAMHGLLAFSLLTARVGGEAIASAIRFADLTSVFAEFTVHLEGDTVVITYRSEGLPADLRAFIMDRAMSGTSTMTREVLGWNDLPVSAVHLQHPAPADISSYTAAFGIEPVFGAATNAFRFHRRYLELPIPQANALTHQGYELACQALVAKRRARTGVAGAVRSVLSTRIDKGIDAVAVAAELQMSPRTLARKLEQEGTSFRILADEVRETIAEELLTSAKMPTAQVAQRLGYTDAASFSRAFKRWKGVSPQIFRTGPQPIAAT